MFEEAHIVHAERQKILYCMVTPFWKPSLYAGLLPVLTAPPPPNYMLIWVSKFMQDFTESKNHWTLYIVQWTLYIGQSTLNNVQCTTDILHCTMDIVHCTTGILQCTMDIYIVEWTLLIVQLLLFIVQWTLFIVQWTFRTN